MSIDELIVILENRLAHNARMREGAVLRGDVDLVSRIDADTATTEASLAALRALLP
jgi:hypothetical protein